MKKQFLFISLTFLVYQLFGQHEALELFLKNSPDIDYERVEDSNNKNLSYKLRIKQPLDHSDLTKGYFTQLTYLTHKDFNRLTVMAIEGYALPYNRTSELAQILKGNQITIEHRFFGNSKPDSLDYKHLNLRQATADLHRIKKLFQGIYSKNWISSGISKGGTTALFYKYFYPKDVSACVAYVAPLAKGIEDKRIYRFLDTVGSRTCRKNIRKLQTLLLKNKETIIPLLKKKYLDEGNRFTYLNFEQAFEYAILEIPFSFWQWGDSCDLLARNCNDFGNAMKYLISSRLIPFFSDSQIEYYGPHYFQAATELGYYGYDIKKLKKHISALPKNTNPSALFIPNKTTLNYDTTLATAFESWLKTNGNNIIYIYGTLDTWSACALTPSKKVNSRAFILNEKHHGNARISEMNIKEKTALIFYLEKWTSNNN